MKIERNQYLETAIQKAAKSHNHVKQIAPNTYRVVSGLSFDGYIVMLSKRDNELHATCSCPAGSFDKVCHHVVSAGWLHRAIYQQKKAGAQ